MSYSFSMAVPTKEEAKVGVAREFDRVVSPQPSHAKDRAAVIATVGLFIDMLVEPGEGQGVNVSVSGSLGWRAENEFTGAGINVSASVG